MPGISTTDEGFDLFYTSKRDGVIKYKTNNETIQTTQTDKRTDTDNRIHCTYMQYIYTTQTDRQSDTDNGFTATDLQYDIVHTHTIRLVLHFLLTVKVATLIFISGCGSAIPSAEKGKSGFIYNLVKN